MGAMTPVCCELCGAEYQHGGAYRIAETPYVCRRCRRARRELLERENGIRGADLRAGTSVGMRATSALRGW